MDGAEFTSPACRGRRGLRALPQQRFVRFLMHQLVICKSRRNAKQRYSCSESEQRCLPGRAHSDPRLAP